MALCLDSWLLSPPCGHSPCRLSHDPCAARGRSGVAAAPSAPRVSALERGRLALDLGPDLRIGRAAE